MHSDTHIKAIRDAILSAENSLRTAKHLLSEILGEDMKSHFSVSTKGLSSYTEDEHTIIE